MPDWEQIFGERGKFFTEPHKDMARIADLFCDKGVRRVLDLGCGTGRHLVFLSKRGFEVYGFDASPRALSIAHQWLHEEGLEADLRLHRMENRFPYADTFFDAIISTQVIHHNLMKDTLKTVREIDRVLKPEGLLFITVSTMTEYRSREDWALELIEKDTYLPHAGPESGLLHHYFTEEEIRTVFSSFDVLEMYIDDTRHRCFLGVKRNRHGG